MIKEDHDTQQVEPDSPNRCQTVTSKGQCTRKAAPGSVYCSCHGGNTAQQSAEKQATRNYRLNSFRARIQEFGDSSHVKSIREEIGILRLIMEEQLNSCQSNTDLILKSQAICDLVMKIEHVVVSCHKLESQMGQMLDKQAIIKFANLTVDLISQTMTSLIESQSISEDQASLISNTLATALIDNLADFDA